MKKIIGILILVAFSTMLKGQISYIDDKGSKNVATNATFTAGNANSIPTTNNQIEFGYNGTTTYVHAIKTRHNNAASAGNAIDFYVWNSTDPAATKAGKHVFTLDGNGNVGIGITTPKSKLEIDGAATNLKAANAGSGTSIDFSLSNLAYTTANAGSAFTLSNMKDGGTYTLAVQGTSSGSSTFSSSPTAYTFKYVNNGSTVPNTHTLYTFVVMGTTVYVYMATGF